LLKGNLKGLFYQLRFTGIIGSKTSLSSEIHLILLSNIACAKTSLHYFQQKCK